MILLTLALACSPQPKPEEFVADSPDSFKRITNSLSSPVSSDYIPTSLDENEQVNNDYQSAFLKAEEKISQHFSTMINGLPVLGEDDDIPETSVQDVIDATETVVLRRTGINGHANEQAQDDNIHVSIDVYSKHINAEDLMNEYGVYLGDGSRINFSTWEREDAQDQSLTRGMAIGQVHGQNQALNESTSLIYSEHALGTDLVDGLILYMDANDYLVATEDQAIIDDSVNHLLNASDQLLQPSNTILDEHGISFRSSDTVILYRD